jgi:hypothetical protein
MLTTVHDEAGPTISAISQSFSGNGQLAPIDPSLYSFIVGYLLVPAARSLVALDCGLYDVDTSDSDGTRAALLRLGTD